MNDLLSIKKVSDLSTLLSALLRAGFVFRDMIDGGAGSGLTSRQMLEYGTGSSRCFAFEPYPGNHRFFIGADPRIELIKAALAGSNGQVDFAVSSIVEADSEWGQRGMEGYSSVGKVSSGGKGDRVLRVDCVRADDVIPQSANIDFIKLDLQGGELSALQGMTSLLETTPFVWVEFMKNKLLLECLLDHGFHLFDTEYFFLGDPSPVVLASFEVSRSNEVLSTGRTAFFAHKKTGWIDYFSEFMMWKEHYGLVQTDLFCVKREYLDFVGRALANV